MKIKNLYIRGQKTVPFEVRMNNGRTVFRSKKPWTLACGASFLLISGFALLVTLITGCETVPVKKEPSKITYRAAVPLVKIKKVVVDAGHGGYDPGAIGRTGLKEKDVNLDIAKRLSNLLRSEGVKVTLTRSSDTFVSLGKRVRLANDSGADLFVSIHSNASRTRSLCGFETYYVSHGVNDSKRAAYAARNVDLDLSDSFFASRSLNLKAIIWDMLYAYNRAESIELSHSICDSISDNTQAKILGVKSARFEVLRGVRMPAVLVETGFLSNYNEEKMLRSGAYRQKIAESIIDGIHSYAQGLVLTEVAKK